MTVEILVHNWHVDNTTHNSFKEMDMPDLVSSLELVKSETVTPVKHSHLWEKIIGATEEQNEMCSCSKRLKWVVLMLSTTKNQAVLCHLESWL